MEKKESEEYAEGNHTLRRLQSVMNTAAKLIHCRRRYATPLLQDLHWLKSPE
jgi:hypothetical protein